MEEIQQTVGSSPNKQYTSTKKDTAKMMAEYWKLKRELTKEISSNKRQCIQMKNQKLKNEQLTQKLKQLQKELEAEEARWQSRMKMYTQGWRSAIITRKYEEKIRGIQAELEKRNKLQSDTRVLLKESAKREQKLLHQKEELQKKVSMLEQFPDGSCLTDTEVIKQYQQARLKIDQLEKDNKELIHEFRMVKQGNYSRTDFLGDDILTKASSYDKVVAENIELMMALRSSELQMNKLKLDNKRMKEELSNFGPDFFKDINSLQFNYEQLMEKNAVYKKQLQKFSDQFGVKIPGL
ncbi:hypothetical protein ACJMK2_028143 [Sinanodonta woodiana]|uniref:Uncharacterized protein n=1 Tax=Sinanodonta woodiana TaxID=1069815 RepID=A0ABD3X8F1_SINWO